MIVQCEQCQTRFNLADEKLREGGIKVRCSKCKHIFKVEPPDKEPAVPAAPEISPPSPPPAAVRPPEPPSSETRPATDRDEEIDFGEFNMEPVPESEAPEEAPEKDEEVEFGFAEGEGHPDEITFEQEEAGTREEAEEESDEGFTIQPEEEKASAIEPSAGGETVDDDEMFSFDEPAQESGKSFSFGDDSAEGDQFSWDEGPPEPSPEEFEFEKPKPRVAEEDLGFGEIALPGREEEGGSGQLSSADLAPEMPGAGNSEDTWHSPPPSSRKEQTAAPPSAKKPGKGKGLQFIVLFLLLIVGGAIGFLYWQEGTVDLEAAQKLFSRLTGKPQVAEMAQKIDVGNLKGYFITNRQEGQLFVIAGKATNHYPHERSAIQIKGLIFDKNGKIILQQSAYAGNPLADDALKTWPFAKFSEAMNNQFGDSLSNLNLGPGKSVKFTVVFKNLPSEMAEFSVEVVGSQPGS